MSGAVEGGWVGAAALGELAGELRADYFRGVQPLWGGGLEVEPFIAYQRRLADSPEARGRYQILGLVERGELLSALKVYTLSGSVDGRALSLRGIGAVFTPESQRRCGHAARMLRLALAQFAAEGAHAALLFSDIGAPYYERLGFLPIESRECRIDATALPRQRGARPAGAGDEEAMVAALARHRGQLSGLSLVRDGWSLRFQLRRLRELARVRHVGEPDWGLVVDSEDGSEALGAAMFRYTKDGLDLLDAAWDTGAVRDALLGALRDRLLRSGRSQLRLWPAHQLRGLFPAQTRDSALAMIAPLPPHLRSIPAGVRAELALLDHI